MQDCLIALNGRNQSIIAGTDVTVAYILERLSSGDSIDDICRDKRLTPEQVRAAVLFAELDIPHYALDRILHPELNPSAPDRELDYSLLSAYMS